jgi:hypothetical protein
MRISKEILEFESGKDDGFQPAARSRRSPGLNAEAQQILAQRGAKQECHSDNVEDAAQAQQVQVTVLKSKGVVLAPSGD